MTAELASMNAKQRQAAENAIHAERLRALIPENKKVYVQLHSTARSGMSRTLSLHVIHDGELLDITHMAAPLIGETWDPRTGAMRVTGCGMDMGFQTVYSLSYALYGRGVETGNFKSDGPYTLKHEWM